MQLKTLCKICGEAPRIRRQSYCKDCQAAYYRAWRERNVESIREYKRRAHKNTPRDVKFDRHLRNRYGISNEQYLEMLNEQGGVCKICSGESMRLRLSVDHCHETGRVRGLLCERCNTMLGRVNDDPTILERAADYLRGIEDESGSGWVAK